MIATFQKRLRHSISWFELGILGLFLFSFAFRFWGLGRFNSLVFDEAHFAKYANNYLTHTPFYEMHPPLGKYLIAIGIWVSKLNPFGYSETNTLTGSALSPISYRCMNALVGSLIPVVVVGLVNQVSRRRSFALWSGLFIALDGLFLVESRYALINVYLLIFGLLGQWLLLLGMERRSPRQRQPWLIGAGVCFGAAAAVKWNGLAFLLAVYLLWVTAKGVDWLQRRWSQPDLPPSADRLPAETDRSPAATITDPDASAPVETDQAAIAPPPPVDLPETPFQTIAQLKLSDILYELGLIPFITYYLTWLPHLQLNREKGFLGWHQYMLQAHKAVGNGADVHPYCSNWYTWLWMKRPVWYYFEEVKSLAAPKSSLSTATPTQTVIEYNVHGLGNPVLWWLSTVAIAIFLIGTVQAIAVLTSRVPSASQKVSLTQTPAFWIATFLTLNYIANLLPWIQVTRCTFLYHYMGAYIFALLGLAWFVDHWLKHPRGWVNAIGATILFLGVVAFVYWLPLYLGLPMSPIEHDSRIWFPSWQ